MNMKGYGRDMPLNARVLTIMIARFYEHSISGNIFVP